MEAKAEKLLRLTEEEKPPVRQEIINFFKKNPNPKDSTVHDFAKTLGMQPNDLETQIYAILSDFLKSGSVGKHQTASDKDFDPNELAMGIEIEKEHSDDPVIRKAIAKDHLSEPGMEDYYTRLKKMEKEAKG